eukprot:scaffold338802_cov28-Prasinocladus_malaysianus.AAC.1
MEATPGLELDFCGGRVDADDGSYSEDLVPRYYTPLSLQLQDDMVIKGLTPMEYVALQGRLAIASSANQTAKNELSSSFFQQLQNGTAGTESEKALLDVPQFKEAVETFAADESEFLEEFAAAWTKMMNADRFEANCAGTASSVTPPQAAIEESSSSLTSYSAASLLFAGLAAIFADYVF